MIYHLSFSSNMKRKNSKLNASSTSAQDDGEFIKKPTDGLRTPNQLSASVIGFFFIGVFCQLQFPTLAGYDSRFPPRPLRASPAWFQ
jgi:hypothetical protein